MVRPDSEAALAEIVASAKAPLAVRGGGTRPIGRPVQASALSTAGLSGVSLYEPGALTVVAGAGTPVAEVEAALASEGQRLAFEPMDHRGLLGTDGEPTLGGVAATNASGPRRIQAGAARDFLLGVRFVDGQGRVIRNGGRVMKNVTGYDLVKLMAGSHGTLGVLTEVSMKVLPVPETAATLVLHGLAVEDAVTAMSRALGSPFEVSGAAYIPEGPQGAPETMMRVEGFDASVRYRAGQLKLLLAGLGAEMSLEEAPDQVAETWRGIRDVAAFHDRPGDVWRFSIKPGDAPALLARIDPQAAMLDWGGGLVWALCAPGTNLRARMGDIRGHATLVRASEATRATTPAFHPEPAPLAAISAELRAKFDPSGIFNPGLMD